MSAGVEPAQLRRVMKEALISDSDSVGGGSGGLPVVELVSLIAEYAICIPLAVHTLSFRTGLGRLSCGKHCAVSYRTGEPEFVFVSSTNPQTLYGVKWKEFGAGSKSNETGATRIAGWGDVSPSAIGGMQTTSHRLGGIAVSDADHSIFVSERSDHVIRRIKDGVVSVVAGRQDAGWTDGDGTTTARFDHPEAIACSPDGQALYVVDQDNVCVRKIALSSGGESKAAAAVAVVQTLIIGSKCMRVPLLSISLDFARSNAELLFGLCFDRTPARTDGETDSQLILSTSDSLERFNLRTRTIRTIQTSSLSLRNVCYAAPNRLLVCAANDVYLIDTQSGEIISLAPLYTNDRERVEMSLYATSFPFQPVQVFNQPIGLALRCGTGVDSGMDELVVVDSSQNRFRVVRGTLLACEPAS